MYKPPFTITGRTVSLVAEITELLTLHMLRHERDLRLRRIHRIQTIHGSLAIEGNNLTSEQVTAILEGKQVIAPQREIQEVRNAIKAYDLLSTWDATRTEHLLEAHAMLTMGLIDESGMFRSGSVGVVAGKDVIHVAPPASRVPYLINDLLGWLNETDEHPLISSSVFHYEFEFIHPFADGNGRVGRLWQTLILSRWNEIFAYLPVENMIYKQQQAYYDAINKSSRFGDCWPFIEFILEVILKSLKTTDESLHDVGVNIGVNVGVNVGVNELEERILLLIDQKPGINVNGIAGFITDKSKRTIERHLGKLKEAGKVEFRGSDKTGGYFIRK